MHTAVRVTLTLLLLLACYWAARMAYADFLYRSGKDAAIRKAATLVPFRAEYQAATGNLKRAVELNPYFTRAWIELGLDAEAKGEMAEAERYLLRANETDRTFEPRWTMANFYLRRERTADFLKWMGLAFERSHGDRTAAYALLWRGSEDSGKNLAAVQAGGGEAVAGYMDFLVALGRLDAAMEAGLGASGEETREARLRVCDALLDAGRGKDAVRLWNRMGIYSELRPEEGRILTNGTIEREPLGKGFDWRLLWRHGVRSYWKAGEFRIVLTGDQQEWTPLLEQFLAAEAGRYRMRYRYRTEGLEAESGVQWRVREAGTGREVGESLGKYLSADDWREDEIRFRGSGRLLRLQLIYERVKGTVRQEGTLWLDGSFQIEQER